MLATVHCFLLGVSKLSTLVAVVVPDEFESGTPWAPILDSASELQAEMRPELGLWDPSAERPIVTVRGASLGR